MHYLYVIVTIIFLVIFATFTATNLQEVIIDFWPFDYQIGLPFAPLLLGGLLIGFLVGCFLMWLRFGAARARARRAEQRAAILEHELVELKRAGEATHQPAPQPASAPPAVAERSRSVGF